MVSSDRETRHVVLDGGDLILSIICKSYKTVTQTYCFATIGVWAGGGHQAPPKCGHLLASKRNLAKANF